MQLDVDIDDVVLDFGFDDLDEEDMVFDGDLFVMFFDSDMDDDEEEDDGMGGVEFNDFDDDDEDVGFDELVEVGEEEEKFERDKKKEWCKKFKVLFMFVLVDDYVDFLE